MTGGNNLSSSQSAIRISPNSSRTQVQSLNPLGYVCHGIFKGQVDLMRYADPGIFINLQTSIWDDTLLVHHSLVDLEALASTTGTNTDSSFKGLCQSARRIHGVIHPHLKDSGIVTLDSAVSAIHAAQSDDLVLEYAGHLADSVKSAFQGHTETG